MRKLFHVRSSSLVLLVSGIGAGTLAQADEASATQSSASTLQEVVVTAQKREERLFDVPMAVTAITSEQLQSQQLVSFADLESRVPGLSLTNIQPGQTRLTLRGQNAGGVGSTVTTYIDDTPFGSSSALANGFYLTGDFDTWDLARVEVLRGPQGTLYGAGSEGGLIKYVTNAPDPTKFAAAAQVGGEDVAHGEAGAIGKGMINLPLGDRAAFRLSGYYSKIPGYIDDPSLGKSDLNDGYRSGVRTLKSDDPAGLSGDTGADGHSVANRGVRAPPLRPTCGFERVATLTTVGRCSHRVRAALRHRLDLPAHAGSQREAVGLFDPARPGGARPADRRAPRHRGGRGRNLESVANRGLADLAVDLDPQRRARRGVPRHRLDRFCGQALQLQFELLIGLSGTNLAAVTEHTVLTGTAR